MFFDIQVQEILWYFLVYALLGWILEVVYHTVVFGDIVNRGFLDGPVCPIYGFGAITVLSLSDLASSFHPALKSPFSVFVFGALFASAIELFAGWLLDTLFHTQWWDYSDKPYHLHGYICLEFSLLWGVASVFAVFILHPFVKALTPSTLPPLIRSLILSLLCLIFLTDVFTTVVNIRQFSKELKELENFQESLRDLSDHLSELIGEKTLATQQKIEERQVRSALESAEFTHRVEAIRKRMRSRVHGTGRLIKAFPHLRSRRHRDTLELLKKLFE